MIALRNYWMTPNSFQYEWNHEVTSLNQILSVKALIFSLILIISFKILLVSVAIFSNVSILLQTPATMFLKSCPPHNSFHTLSRSDRVSTKPDCLTHSKQTYIFSRSCRLFHIAGIVLYHVWGCCNLVLIIIYMIYTGLSIHAYIYQSMYVRDYF